MKQTQEFGAILTPQYTNSGINLRSTSFVDMPSGKWNGPSYWTIVIVIADLFSLNTDANGAKILFGAWETDSKQFIVVRTIGSIKSLRFWRPETLTAETGDKSSVPKDFMSNKQPLDSEFNSKPSLALQECK